MWLSLATGLPVQCRLSRAADSGAKVLLVDSAPEGEEGGNSRFCAQIVVYGQDRDQLLKYYESMGWHMDQDQELLEAYVDGIMGVPDIFKRMGIEEPCIWSEFAATAEGEAGEGGNDETDAQKIKRSFASICPEYPECEGSETVDAVTMHPAYFDGAFYPVVQENVASNESITVWLEAAGNRISFRMRPAELSVSLWSTRVPRSALAQRVAWCLPVAASSATSR